MNKKKIFSWITIVVSAVAAGIANRVLDNEKVQERLTEKEEEES